jgi:predicted RNase H-like HicB family nuclease
MGKVFFELTLPIKIKKEEGMFISCCTVLDIYSQGETEAEAKKNIIEATRLFITTCFERGTLDAVLKECGFTAIKKPVAIPKDHKFIKVPIPFNVTGGYPTAFHA